MADRRRRVKTSQTARIALIFALNAAAAFALWKIWPAHESAVDASASAELRTADGPSDGASYESDGGGDLESPKPERAAVEVRTPVDPPTRVAAVEIDAPEPLSAARYGRLARDLQHIVDDHVEQARVKSQNKVRSDNTAVAIHVLEVGAGTRGEIALGSDRLMRPASNLKLLTTAAALALLGSEWHFETRFEALGEIRDGVLLGDLVLRAAGDPLYDPESNGDVEHLLAPVIDDLLAAGVRAIRGNVVLDEGTFLEPGPGPEWPSEGQHWSEYCALAGGFSLNRGCLTAVTTPTRAGSHARVEVFPRQHGLPESIAVRTEAGGGPNIQIGAKPSGVLVKGTIGASSAPYVGTFAHPDPVELFGRALCASMARRGILIQGRLERVRGAPPGELVAVLRTPLVRYLAPINADSTNALADQVFLATAHSLFGLGTREAGARATQLALERLGVPSDGLVQVDGSGLSRANRVTARQIAVLIESVLRRNDRSSALYRESLAVSGERGTLSDRMRSGVMRGRVRAKTGFIGGTSALSGVAESVDGRHFVFSILVNYPNVDGLNSSVWKGMQDEVCERLVEVQ